MQVGSFLRWAEQQRHKVRAPKDADRAMAIYFDKLFEDCASFSDASYTLYGFIVLRMIPDKAERDLLPLSRAALTAWRGSRPGKSRVGMVPQVIYHFAQYCALRQEWDASAAVLLQYDLYARPSEILQIRGCDFVPSVAAFSSPWGLMFGNSDTGNVTKTGATDDVVLADSSHRTWCNTLLRSIGRQVGPVEAPVFSLSLSRYERLFRDFSQATGLAKGLFTPHVIRHSGPSFDLIHRYRDFAAIQARGRWAAPQSVERYKKPGRLLLTAARLPCQFQKFTDEPLHEALKRLLSHSWA